MSPVLPTREIELGLLEQYDVVIGMDEVGRGALAGPVAVGAAVVSRSTGAAPQGLADSKLLNGVRRQALISPIRQWIVSGAVGWSSPSEVSEQGLTWALRLAGLRAIAMLLPPVAGIARICILLDGNYNWLKTPEQDLFSTLETTVGGCPSIESLGIDVAIRVKADRDASVVSAASVLAKVSRDRYMGTIADPGYDWARNKGYASPSHIEALRTMGPSRRHRLGWNLPGLAVEVTGNLMDEGGS